ncbi:alpha-hydroxy-acid oxidizing protein [Nocardiopsis valliformis]|uniref:alpha-hydroxy-acid oxidizing protein n=1 Tax=Nocardiopsis valliformis TaxID=239974 RepID=UPI000345644B|nr:alpha-hydroxy-acid oxidizing protein [Nocardiopsis valliformis]
MASRYGDYQLEIYLNGLTGVVPSHPMTFAELERRAADSLPPWIWSYVAGGAGDEHTQDANATAFRRWGLYPRMFVGAAERDTGVDLCGVQLPSPLMMAPVGVVGLCSQDRHGDLTTAEAAARTGVPMIASTLSQDPMEEVAARFGDTPGFFQLYTPTDRELAASLVRRAEAAGFKGIVVTLDTWVTGWRPRDLATANFPQLRGHCLANYTSDPVFQERVGKDASPEAVVAHWAGIFGNPLTWDDLPWLRSLTDLPLIVKGVCHADDARRAADGGVDGIYVSNHGGRQANGGIPALECLPDVAAATDLPIIFDSGVRSGSDAVKALALGATTVAIGRPYVYGLALGGVEGLVHVLRTMLAEADLLMAVDGYPSLADLTPAALKDLRA